MKKAIDFINISFSYNDFEVLKDITTTIKKSGLHALFGPNGSGKSTLIKCLVGLLPLKEGNILVEGRDIAKLSAKEMSKLVAYVPQEHKQSFPFLVEEMVLMGRTPYLGGVRGPRKEDLEYAHSSLEKIGIGPLSKKFFSELSGGQRQLVLIARALCQDTPIMVLDEPTAALDFKNQMGVWRTLEELRTIGKTIIACTHDPNHVLWFCDTVLILNNGQLYGHGTPQELIVNETLKSLYGDACYLKDGIVCPSE